MSLDKAEFIDTMQYSLLNQELPHRYSLYSLKPASSWTQDSDDEDMIQTVIGLGKTHRSRPRICVSLRLSLMIDGDSHASL